MTTKPEGPAQEPLNVGGETKCKNCEQPKSAHLASGHIYCPISLGRACWYEPVVPATPVPSQPAGAREWLFEHAPLAWNGPNRVAHIVSWMDAYARQQTAAKDTEAETFRCQLRDALKLHPNVTWFGAGLLTAASAVVAERDSLREANARLAADLDAALKAGKDGQK